MLEFRDNYIVIPVAEPVVDVLAGYYMCRKPPA